MADEAQATGPQQSGGMNTPTIAIFGVVFLLVLFGSLFFQASGNTECPTNKTCKTGASSSESIDLTNTKVSRLLDDLKTYARPDEILTQPQKLDPLILNLQAAIDELNTTPPPAPYASLSPEDRAKLLALLTELNKKAQAIKSNPTGPEAISLATQFLDQRNDLNELWVSLSFTQGSPPKDGFANPIGNATPIRFNNSLHDCGISKPSGCDDPGHRVAVGSLGPGGSDIPAHKPDGSRNLGEAVDIMLPTNTPIYAPFSGKITKRGVVAKGGGMGYQLVIESNDGRYVAALLHLNHSDLIASSTVTVGEKVGSVFPLSNHHLHFELWVDGKPVNAGTENVKPADIWAAQKAALGFK